MAVFLFSYLSGPVTTKSDTARMQKDIDKHDIPEIYTNEKTSQREFSTSVISKISHEILSGSDAKAAGTGELFIVDGTNLYSDDKLEYIDTLNKNTTGELVYQVMFKQGQISFSGDEYTTHHRSLYKLRIVNNINQGSNEIVVDTRN